MAVHFANSDSRTFFHKVVENAGGGAVVTAAPLSMWSQFNPDAFPSVSATLIGIERDPPGFGGYDHFRLLLESVAGGQRVAASTRQGIFSDIASAASAYSLNAWQSAGAVFASSTSRKAYYNGVVGTEDTTSRTPSGLENTYIGARPTVTSGYWTAQPHKGCMAKLGIWSSALSDANMLSLHGGTDPRTISPSTLVLFMAFDDEGTAAEAWAWTGAAVTQIADMFLHVTLGALTTCADSPAAPDPEPEDECGPEDEADVVAACDVTWPECDLVPSGINVEVVSSTVSPGRALSGREQIVQPDAGHWRITLDSIKVWTEAQVLQWREIESTLNGRNGTCCVPVYEGVLSATPIAAIASIEKPIGATQIDILQTAGADIRAGMHFSAGEWLYRITRIVEDQGSGIETFAIWPPLREALDASDTLNFNTPSCRCRLERDDGMNINLELLRFARPSVTFVEDV